MKATAPGRLGQRLGAPKLVILILVASTARGDDTNLLRQTQSIALPGITGRMDHLAADPDGNRLFLTALGNNTVEVLDLVAGKRTHQITGLKEPQGLAYLPRHQTLFVTNGDGATINLYHGKTFDLLHKIDVLPDPDNLRYDAAADRLYVGHGAGIKGCIGVIDPAAAVLLYSIPAKGLRGHPESFQLETRGPRIFVNVPAASQVAVLDRKSRSLLTVWGLTARDNFPMALDEDHRRLFVGCRSPARLLVLNTDTGKVVAEIETVGDTDDLFYDARSHHVYVSGGEGLIAVYHQDDADRYTLIGKRATAPGARTSLFVPARHALYLAVPHRGDQSSEVRTFDTGGAE